MQSRFVNPVSDPVGNPWRFVKVPGVSGQGSGVHVRHASLPYLEQTSLLGKSCVPYPNHVVLGAN